MRHEALHARKLPYTGINANAFKDHGTAALGVVTMKTGKGTYTGVAPEVNNFVVSQWRPDGTPNEADAILYAVSCLGAGDVLLLETQSFDAATGDSLWPIEIQDAVFDVIQLATTLGITVIEPAGNGNTSFNRGNNLDHYSGHSKNIFNPATTAYRDSGAIIVAAATSSVPHHRIPSSNYGRRVNCYAWGEGVTTAGSYPNDSGKSGNCYTTVFNGTSSAAAIIAGACICIQSTVWAARHQFLHPTVIRSLVANPAMGTPAGKGTTGKIGVMPDLKKILHHCLQADHLLINTDKHQ